MTALSTRPSSFRKDINGLRAWAVVAVILFHFGIFGAEGGFVGVDIFFVISGYLMTGIIIDALEKKDSGVKFSLLNFYIARARRIIPALLALCLTLMVLGWFWLSAVDYKMLSEHVLTSLSFISNIQFWSEAGYFDASSFDKWLLHTWSLSVEWQFYIILPVMLLLLWKIRPHRDFIIIAFLLGLMLTLGLSIILTPLMPVASFYLLPTRAWEMLAGGLIFLLADKIKLNNRQSKGIEVVGFILLLWSIFFFRPTDAWPGYLAIIPVLGTAFILVANRLDSILTAPKPAQWLGNTSYSLYLWHWPFVVALYYMGLQENVLAISVSLLLTAIAGYASYKLIENPSRFYLNKISLTPSIIGFSAAVFAVGLPAFVVKGNSGIPNNRLPESVEIIFSEVNNKNPRIKECYAEGATPVPECTYGGEELGVIVIGDSHAASLVRSIEKALPSKSLHVLDWTLSNCPTIKGVKDKIEEDDNCGSFVDYILYSDVLLSSKQPVIIATRNSLYIEGPNETKRMKDLLNPRVYISKPYSSRENNFYQELTESMVDTACAIAKNRHVYMVRPIPEMIQHVPHIMGRNQLLFGEASKVSISRDDYYTRNAKAIIAQNEAVNKCGVKILDPLDYLCDNNACYGDKDGLPIYYDDNHLNERGGQLLIPMFKEIFLNTEEA